MPNSRPVTLLALAALGGVVLGCGLADVFASSGLESVVLTYQGDTLISKGATVPFHVTAWVGRDSLVRPRLVAVSSDPNIVVVTPGQDSLLAVGGIGGRATVTVRLLSSILTDSAPTLAQGIRVIP